MKGVTNEWIEILERPNVDLVRKHFQVSDSLLTPLVSSSFLYCQVYLQISYLKKKFTSEFLINRKLMMKEFVVLVSLCYTPTPSENTKIFWERSHRYGKISWISVHSVLMYLTFAFFVRTVGLSSLLFLLVIFISCFQFVKSFRN